MEVEFLKNFNLRMKKLGSYALICKNSMFKSSWKNYGFNEDYEYLNLIFAVLLYIMEQSLKDENCTLDDIAVFIDDINSKYFNKSLSFEQCKNLGEFIVNTILCDDGKVMYFKGFNFEDREYKDIHISFIGNKIVYINNVVKRTSYYLTDEGYSLLLSTLEMENNLRLTIHELIFKMHLEKATYDRAVEDIKSIFNILRMQLQKMEEAIRRIKENALNYSVEEYSDLLQGNMESLQDTRGKFKNYKEHVDDRIKELKEKDINIKRLDEKELDNLKYLGIISKYLTRTIEEQQKILNSHFNLKNIYARELREISSMAIIKRFNITTEIFDKIIEDSSKLEAIEKVFRPLFNMPIEKKYNLNKSLQYQKVIKEKEVEEDELISFEDEDWEREKEEQARKKLLSYKEALRVLLELICDKEETSLGEISKLVEENKSLKEILIPKVEVFREIIIELLKGKEIHIQELREEISATLQESGQLQFQLNEVLLDLVEEEPKLAHIKIIKADKLFNNEKVKFSEVSSEKGKVKSVICSDVLFKIS